VVRDALETIELSSNTLMCGRSVASVSGCANVSYELVNICDVAKRYHN